MSFLRKLTFALVVVLLFIPISFAEIIYSDEEIHNVDTQIYTVDSIGPGLDPNEFVVNNKIYDPKTDCDIAAGDKITFVEHTPYDCVDAQLLNLRTKKICEVWCDL